MSKVQDRYRGCLLGLAAGDAMGLPVDNKSWEQIQQAYGPNGLLGYDLQREEFAEISSYTQLCAYLCNSLLLYATRGGTPMGYIQLGLKEWTRSQQFHRDPEKSFCWIAKLPAFRRRHCRDARMLDNLRLNALGTPERPSNSQNSPSALTAAIAIGMYYHPKRMEPQQIGQLAAQTIALTHGDPQACLSAAELAYAITGILQEPEVPLREHFSAAIAAMDHQFRNKFSQAFTVANYLGDVLEQADQDYFPQRSILEKLQCRSALEVLGAGMYVSLLSQENFDGAMIAAVNHSGYSSAVGAVTGAILGANMGADNLPDFYLESLEVREPLWYLADDMVSGTPITGLFDDDWDQKYTHGMPL